MDQSNRVIIEVDQCKGCGVCVSFCPRHCLTIGSHINKLGYRNVEFVGEGNCIACGICFYSCPEPGALTVVKADKRSDG